MSTNIKGKKRIVLVHADKGGCGKSTVSRALIDHFIRSNVAVDAYDSDKRNPDLSRFYDKKVPITLIDLPSKTAFDTLLDKLSTRQNNALVDLAAGAGDALNALVKGDIQLAGALQDLDAQLTIVFVLSRSRSSLAALRQALTDFESVSANWVIVRNTYFGEAEKFVRFANSNTRAEAQARGAIEIDMPELLDDLFDELDQASMPFCDAVQYDKLTFTNRRRIIAWLEKFDAEINKAKAYL